MFRKSSSHLFVFLVVLACLGGCGAAHATAFGYVRTTIQPPEAAAAGAQWRVDDGAWQDSVLMSMLADEYDAKADFWMTQGWLGNSEA